MNERMKIQREVMSMVPDCVNCEGGHTVPGKNFQKAAKLFSEKYQPDKSAQRIAEEIQDEL